MQRKKNYEGQTGKPILLYNAPELYGAEDQLCEVENNDYIACREEIGDNRCEVCDPDIAELCRILMDENDWRNPNNCEEAVQLYLNLRHLILQQL